jgi:hypothetical protein
MSAASDDRSAMERAAVAEALLLPHYAQLRAAARVAVYCALEFEKSGRSSDGIRIRVALVHCGSLMRDQSPSIVGSLVGVVITNAAMPRPGGSPSVAGRGSGSGQELPRQRLAAYTALLERHGESREAAWARAESAAAEQVQSIARRSFALSPFGVPMLPLILFWALDLLVLANILCLLALAIAAPLLARAEGARGVAPLVVAAVIAGFASLAWIAPWGQTLDSLRVVLLGLATPGAPTTPQSPADLFLRVLAIGPFRMLLAVTAPCLLLFALVLLRAIRRIPLSQALVFGLKRTTLPFACLLALLYGGMARATVQLNKKLNTAVGQALRGEGRCVAAASGQTWPGPVR